MKAVFIELPAFARYRSDYLTDEDFAALQTALMQNPLAGDVIQGSGGLRKIRWKDTQRGKGKRGGCVSSITGGKQGINAGCLPCTAKMKQRI